MSLIHLENIKKIYQMGEVQVPALRGVSLNIERGEFVSLMGKSGSGKSTLMHIIGCLDRLTSGRYLLDERDISTFDDDRLAGVRNAKIGFVFQSFNLLTSATALENVALPLLYRGVKKEDRLQTAKTLLEKVDLADRLHHFPSQLSGGQQQRVAIARALANSPVLLLADEPTGDLDSAQSKEIMAMIKDLNRQEGLTVLVVTHDAYVGEQARRIVTLFDGRIQGEEINEFA